MKYKVGDKVWLRCDLENKECYGCKVWVDVMLKGCKVTIKRKDESGYYTLKEEEEREYSYTDEMIAGYADEVAQSYGIPYCWLKTDDDTNNYNKSEKEKTMELTKPKTKLEKDACAKAKKDAVEKALLEKSEEYATHMTEYIRLNDKRIFHEKKIKEVNDQMKDMEDKLGITAADKKDLF